MIINQAFTPPIITVDNCGSNGCACFSDPHKGGVELIVRTDVRRRV